MLAWVPPPPGNHLFLSFLRPPHLVVTAHPEVGGAWVCAGVCYRVGCLLWALARPDLPAVCAQKVQRRQQLLAIQLCTTPLAPSAAFITVPFFLFLMPPRLSTWPP